MLYDVKNLERKKQVEQGNQEALYELAEAYAAEYQRSDLACAYYSKIIENNCQCLPKHYLYSILFLAAFSMDEEKTEEALQLYKRAKEFMEKEMPEEEWVLRVYENIGYAKKILLLKKRIDKGDQAALYELASDWKNEKFGIENEHLANRYFSQLIAKECKIEKEKYIDAHLFVGWYAAENKDLEKAFASYKKAKEFMEKEIPEEDWHLSVFESLISVKIDLIEQEKNK